MNKKGDKKDEPKVTVKNATDLQRLKLEKLMKNPDKEVVIPDRGKEKKMPHAPEFIRNVMGSSAGAGSGEFHVYRHLRRKEYARQKFIQQQKEKNRLDEEFRSKVEESQKAIDEKTAKKRAKRLKKKQKLREAKKRKAQSKGTTDDDSKEKQESSDEDDDKDGESDEEKPSHKQTETDEEKLAHKQTESDESD